MKAAAITAESTVVVVDQPRPSAHGDLVVVKVIVAPMCTEFKERPGGVAIEVLGHEASGVVVDAGGSTRVSVGDRVAVMPGNACGTCRYCVAGEHIYCQSPRDVLTETGQPYGVAGYAQYVLKPDWLLLQIPDDVSLEHAAAACCLLGPSFNAAQRMNLNTTDTLLVTGLGPVGLGAVVNGVTRGATVFALDVNPYRLALGESLGATTLDPASAGFERAILDATDGFGVTTSIETSGVLGNPAVLAGLSARRAHLSIVAWGLQVELPPIVPLGLDVHGIWHWKHQTDGGRMIETIRKATALLDRVTTHRFDLDDISLAMDVQDTGRCGKVLLFPHGLQAEEL